MKRRRNQEEVTFTFYAFNIPLFRIQREGQITQKAQKTQKGKA
jgi:hypothetical protein